jgi:alkylation response protein AidB-like acyl-CoA dehydrogenase
MAKYDIELRDIKFNLFEHLEIQKNENSPDQAELGDILEQFNKFVENEIFPTRVVGDIKGVTLTDKGVTIPEEFHKALDKYYENGWFTIGFPEKVGGMPVPHAMTVATVSLNSGANLAMTSYAELGRAFLNTLLTVGSEEQINFIAPQIVSGTWGGTMCLTEAGAGSDVGALKTTATPTGDGRYKIQGTKIFITGGENDYFKNIIHLVLARTPGAPEGTKGLSLFLVPRYTINEDGSLGEGNNVVCTKTEEKMGIHASATCEMTFGRDGDCYGTLLGNELEGMKNMFIMMNEARLLCAIQGECHAGMVFCQTKKYTTERAQFGQEIIKHPDVKKTLLKMRAMSRGLRAFVLYTANLFDKKTEEAERQIGLLTPIAKAFCTDEGFNTAVDAIQTHGGYGYCQEYEIEQYARDVKIASIYEGTNAIQAIDLVMRKIIKDQGVAFKELMGDIQKTLGQAPAELAKNAGFLGECLKDLVDVTTEMGTRMAEKKVDDVLFSSTDYLAMCGNIVVAWRLLSSAVSANQLKDSNSTDSSYYASKLDDFNIFCSNYLVRNKSLFLSVKDFGAELREVEV